MNSKIKKSNSMIKMAQTCRLTNSMNLIGYHSFNHWGGISLHDILSNYSSEILDKCWENLSRLIIENYQSGKGTFIKGFGTFTFTNADYSLEGTTNEYERDLKSRRPVFIVSNEFIDYLKPGIYTEKSGLLYFTEPVNNNIPIVKVNYAKICYGTNISKEECVNIILSLIRKISEQVRKGIFQQKEMKYLGKLIIKNNLFGMKFEDDIYNDISFQAQKLYHLKKNLKLDMETKDSIRQVYRNVEDIDKLEREVRPKMSVITKIMPSGDEWLKENMGIDVKKEIENSPRKDLDFQEAKNKDEYKVDQRYYRPYPIQDLYGLKISQDILESIYNNKSLLVKNMKFIDRHGDGLIPKYDFINSFFKTNCHHSLRIELIEKIVNVYINNDPNVIMIQYNNLLNALCKDIKQIVDKEYKLFPIKKYKYTIKPDNKRLISSNSYDSFTGNLEQKAISSLFKFKKLPKIEEIYIKDDLLKLSKICPFLSRNRNHKMISYLQLNSMLQSYMISLSKEKIIKILKYLDIQNPNAFYLDEFINKINQKVMNSTTYDFRKDKNKPFTFLNKNKSLNNIYYNNNESKKTMNLNKNLSSEDLCHSQNYKNYDIENENNDIELNIKSIKLIKDRIFKNSLSIDNISEYFDHLLSYNICRRENIIYPDEFERLLQLERFPFTIPEINKIFRFIDTKKDDYIDRIEFINSIKNVPHPISTLINYMRNNKLSIIDLAYKMDIDIYNRPIDEILETSLSRLLFQVKMKSVSSKFDREFINGLFDALYQIHGNNNKIYVKTIFKVFNITNTDSYKELYNSKQEICDLCLNMIPKLFPYEYLKQKFLNIDKNITKRIPLDSFMNIIRNELKGKIKDEIIIQLLRTFRLIDINNNVKYHSFLMLIYLNSNNNDHYFGKCLFAFVNFLKNECNDDLFIFVAKINNMCNNTSIKKTIDIGRMHEFLKRKIDNNLDISSVMKFDFDRDGLISMDDLKNIIIHYVDKNYFENKAQISNREKMNMDLNNYNENKKMFKDIKQALNKINMTEDNLFYYLDYNQDNVIDIDEFEKQIIKLPLEKKYTSKQIRLFFTFLDEYNIGAIDINIFKIKLNIFNNDILINDDSGYKGNSTIENLILAEFSKWYLKNSNLSDTELFPILDHDHDGKISINDIKYFAVNVLLMAKDELTNSKILHFIEAVSLSNGNKNLLLSDIQNLIKNIKENNTKNYLVKIKNFCNEGINKKNKELNKEWFSEIINIIGLFIDENYDGDIQKFYNDYNTTDFRNQGKGLSLDNFINFLQINNFLFESFYINDEQKKILFNYISGDSEFINIQRLKEIFGDKKSFDFYDKMHKNITKFLHENFPTSEDAFKFFHNVKTELKETPTCNDKISLQYYIHKKDFFNGINRMFPEEYQTNTILNYYNRIFKKNPDSDPDIIKYSEFNYIYYNKFNFDSKYPMLQKKDSKILTTRKNIEGKPFMTFNSPFITKEHKKFQTPYDLDPLEKIKRLIASSKNEFKGEFIKYINESSNGMANQFEFRNMIKRLGLGLTNIEIEDIIHKSGLTSDGNINLINFMNYITDENKNLLLSKKHIKEQLKEIKQLIYKYYTNPRLAFELNNVYNIIKGPIIDFEIFKKIIYDIYKREAKKEPTYSVMKYIYDYIDIRKDGIIDLNEWNKIFAMQESTLDLNQVKQSQLQKLRNWETSNDIIFIYKLIGKNRKIIRERVFAKIGNNPNMLIKVNQLIDILKNVLFNVKLSQTQWKMIASIGDMDKSGIIDFNIFMSIIENTNKVGLSHPKNK